MGEFERIRALIERFGKADLLLPSGDDAAVVESRSGVSVTSVDAIVDRVHFDSRIWPADAIGYKAVAAALSDLAAMGAAAGELYVAAGLPADFDDQRFAELTDGIAAAAKDHQAVVAGGDLVAADQLWVSVTVVGSAASSDAVVSRDGAKVGDAVVVTGDLGRSARALELIEQGAVGDRAALEKQLRPRAQLGAGRALAACGAHAMLDISDGLVQDAGHIAAASNVKLEIELERIPLGEEITDPSYAAGSGEEYELLATISPQAIEVAGAAVTAAGTKLTVIGRVCAGSGAELLDSGGRRVEVRGFDHFD